MTLKDCLCYGMKDAKTKYYSGEDITHCSFTAKNLSPCFKCRTYVAIEYAAKFRLFTTDAEHWLKCNTCFQGSHPE